MLRKYQSQVINKMLWSMSLPGNDIIVSPTGSGKSHLISGFIEKLGQPVLVLVPSKEILEQDLDKLSRVVDKNEIGIYSASMNSKEIKKYTLSTIQSAYKHPEKFAHYDIAIIDECHGVSPKNLDGMYNKFFKAIGIKKIYGFTATPFRQDIIYKYPPNYRGFIWQKAQIEAITTTKMINRYANKFWSRILSVISTQELIDQGFLSPIEYHEINLVDHEQIKTNKSKSDFDLEDFDQQLSSQYTMIAKFIKELPHKSKLVFCSSIKQAEAISDLIPSSKVVTSTTKAKEREKTILDLREGRTEVVLNVSVLTTGFDYPELDSIIILRPTRSLGLHCQMIGRLSRIAPNKTCGHVYDLVSNVKNLGKLEEIEIKKIDNKWNVVSPAHKEGFHYLPLYSFRLRKPEYKFEKRELTN